MTGTCKAQGCDKSAGSTSEPKGSPEKQRKLCLHNMTAESMHIWMGVEEREKLLRLASGLGTCSVTTLVLAPTSKLRRAGVLRLHSFLKSPPGPWPSIMAFALCSSSALPSSGPTSRAKPISFRSSEICTTRKDLVASSSRRQSCSEC